MSPKTTVFMLRLAVRVTTWHRRHVQHHLSYCPYMLISQGRSLCFCGVDLYTSDQIQNYTKIKYGYSMHANTDQTTPVPIKSQVKKKTETSEIMEAHIVNHVIYRNHDCGLYHNLLTSNHESVINQFVFILYDLQCFSRYSCWLLCLYTWWPSNYRDNKRYNATSDPWNLDQWRKCKGTDSWTTVFFFEFPLCCNPPVLLAYTFPAKSNIRTTEGVNLMSIMTH